MATASIENIRDKGDEITSLLHGLRVLEIDERAIIQEGNSTQAWRLHFTRGDGHYRAPLYLNGDGFLGNTKKEAYHTLSVIYNTLWGVLDVQWRKTRDAVHTVDKEEGK